MYVQRDESGKVTGVFRWPIAGAEAAPEGSEEIKAFQESAVPRKKEGRLERLISVLAAKGVITEEDLKA